jgi:hypothetical protein
MYVCEGLMYPDVQQLYMWIMYPLSVIVFQWTDRKPDVRTSIYTTFTNELA